MHIKNIGKDYASAAAVFLFGAAMAGLAWSYPQGTWLRPGPGFFPFYIGGFIALMGLCIGLEAWLRTRRGEGASAPAEEGPAERFGWRPVIFVSLGVIAFALLLERVGFIPATIALVALTGLSEKPRFGAMIGVCLFMLAFGIVVFIWGLGVPVRPLGFMR